MDQTSFEFIETHLPLLQCWVKGFTNHAPQGICICFPFFTGGVAEFFKLEFQQLRMFFLYLPPLGLLGSESSLKFSIPCASCLPFFFVLFLFPYFLLNLIQPNTFKYEICTLRPKFVWFCFLFAFRVRVSLCCPGCSGTHSVDQAGFGLLSFGNEGVTVHHQPAIEFFTQRVYLPIFCYCFETRSLEFFIASFLVTAPQ